ncbi:MAG: hypothetical protein MUF75_12770 [Bacteroidia bacterium]|jgi:hypothetical protein|nr:hypothetical protein [Bacteroidia bacterium]
MAEPKSQNQKNYLTLGIVILAILFIIKLCGADKKNSSSYESGKIDVTEEKKPVDSAAIIFDFKQSIEKCIDEIEAGFPAKDYQTKDAILMRVDEFEKAARKISESRIYYDTGVIRLKKLLETKLIAAKKETFRFSERTIYLGQTKRDGRTI